MQEERATLTESEAISYFVYTLAKDVELMASTLLALFHGLYIQAHVNSNVDPLKQVQLIRKLFS